MHRTIGKRPPNRPIQALWDQPPRLGIQKKVAIQHSKSPLSNEPHSTTTAPLKYKQQTKLCQMQKYEEIFKRAPQKSTHILVRPQHTEEVRSTDAERAVGRARVRRGTRHVCGGCKRERSRDARQTHRNQPTRAIAPNRRCQVLLRHPKHSDTPAPTIKLSTPSPLSST